MQGAQRNSDQERSGGKEIRGDGEQGRQGDIKRGDFVIHTSAGGRSCGKKYWIRAPTERSCKDWMTTIVQEADRVKALNHQSDFARFQARCARFYRSKNIQNVSAFMIFCSFALNITENQLRPEEGTSTFRTLTGLNITFTILFTLEVLFNLFGSW